MDAWCPCRQSKQGTKNSHTHRRGAAYCGKLPKNYTSESSLMMENGAGKKRCRYNFDRLSINLPEAEAERMLQKGCQRQLLSS